MRAEPAHGWALKLFYRNCAGSFLTGTIYPRRADAIADYNSVCDNPNAYRRDRRRGVVSAVRATLSEDLD